MKAFLPPLVRPFARTFLDLVLPPRCPMTGELVGRNGTLAPAYWAQLNFIQDSFCDTCGAPFRQPMTAGMICGACLQDPPPYARARAALHYNDASAKMILKFKHGDGTQLARIFTTWLQQFGQEILAQADLVVPVPLHRWRLVKRRYNQASLLAALVSAQSDIPCRHDVLLRHRATESQGRKTKAQRAENIRHAFAVRETLRELIQGKNIVLLDDVYTSGATVHECTQILLKAGAAQISVLTVARAGFAS